MNKSLKLSFQNSLADPNTHLCIHNNKKRLLSEKDNFVKKNLISLVQAFLQQDNRFIIVVHIPTKRGSRNAPPHLFSLHYTFSVP